jgi:hypothetical protein
MGRMALKAAQIGRCGELLVQYVLLLRGIESAPMSTDSGVDLVVYAPRMDAAVTVQVKTNLQPKPSGGKGKLGLDWWVSDDFRAQLFALVDLSTQRVWVFRAEEVATVAQQHSSGRYHIYMYTDPTTSTKNKTPRQSYEFEKYLLGNRAHELFSGPA